LLIIVTGTPGTGKTFISKKIASKLKLDYLYIGDVVNRYKLSEGVDKKVNSKLVDVKKLNSVLIKLIKDSKKDLIIDGHLSHFLPRIYVDLCLVCKCGLKTLQKRLIKKKYSKVKVRENLDCEIFDVCLVEALEEKHNVLVVDTSTSIDIGELIKKIKGKV